MKMDVRLFFLAFTMFWKSSTSLKCYQCTPEKLPIGNIPICSHFNHSDAFVEECAASTICFKRETTLNLPNGLVSVSVERGCAPQTMSGDQRRINGKWTSVKQVYEVYEESCREYPSDYERPTKTLHCFCRGDYCNSADDVRLPYATLLTILFCFLIR